MSQGPHRLEPSSEGSRQFAVSCRAVRRLAAVGLLVGVCLPAAAADAAKVVPVYRDPPSFLGRARPPVTKPPPPPAPVPLSRTGVFPDVLVDEAGTAHIVWNEGRGNDADATMYCRVRRGSKTCAGSPTPLTWGKAYAPGSDGPQFNTDDGGPRIVRVGNQLVVFSRRYPTIGEKPDGASSSTVVAWTSADGGIGWSPAAIVGKYALGQFVVFGPSTDPTLLNLGQDSLCGGLSGMCVEAYQSATYTAGGSDLATASNQAYGPTLALDGGLPVAAFTDLANHILVRRWNGPPASVTDPASWTPETVIAGDEPQLAGGRSGLHLMSKPGFGKAFGIRRLTPVGQSIASGPPTTVSNAGGVTFNRLVQDPAGRLIAAWQQTAGKSPGVRMRVSSPAAGVAAANSRVRAAATPPLAFGDEQVLVGGAANGQLALAATGDGGGFAVLNHTGGVNSPGEIVASGFGNPAPTGTRGLGNQQGGGSTGSSCAKVDFGAIDIQAAAGCFFHGEGAEADLVTTRGEIDLFGLKIVPDVGTKVLIDPKKLTIQSFGSVKVLVRSSLTGDVVLWHKPIAFDLSRAVPGSKLLDLPIGDPSIEILGFKPGKNIQVFLEADGVHIKLSLKLPKTFGDIQGAAEFVADRKIGLHANSVHIGISGVRLGVLTINDLGLTYSGREDTWTGMGDLKIASFGGIAASTQFKSGDFNGASIDFHPVAPVVIGPFVYLLGVNGAFTIDPTVISVGGQFGAGVAVKGEAPIKLDGKVTLSFPSQGPAEFKLDGKVSLAVFKLAEGSARFQTDGYADFNVRTDQDIAFLKLKAKLEGFVDAGNGEWGGDFHGEACIDYVIGCLGGSLDAAASAAGIAICGEPRVAGFSATVGLQLPWDEVESLTKGLAAARLVPIPIIGAAATAVFVLDNIQSPCHTDKYRKPPPRAASAQAGGGPLVTVPRGLPTETLLVRGGNGMPLVDVLGPGGTIVAGPAKGAPAAKSAAGSALALPSAASVLFVLNSPRAGTWTVRPRAGSPTIAEVRQSDGYRVAVATAKVGGNGRARTLSYRASNLASGQALEFIERSRVGSRRIGTATGSAGTFRIRPTSQAAGMRSIYTQVRRRGLVTDRTLVARYRALGPAKPGPVAGLRIGRRDTTLTATWRRARGAADYRVTLRGVYGTRVTTYLHAPRQRLRLAGIRRDERIVVEVLAISKALRRGVAARVSSRGARR